MDNALRTLDIRIAEGWRPRQQGDRGESANQFRNAHFSGVPEWQGTHADGTSELVVYSLRVSPMTTFERARSALESELGAAAGYVSGDALVWVLRRSDEYFAHVLKTPIGSGRPLIWVARLRDEAVADRMPEVIAAVEESGWAWARS
ncbi:hypothetical protein [uncultured Agrococcus sp.]|uniref:hypothetical protein n=1 Tax=uncultured Agrococcus sp. TaxID=382258 RepID=UPI0025CC46DD|nr:hypothetical protein [uncultured Agrococcus sp.]